MKTVMISGKEYPVEVRDGEPYINNQTVDEFMDTLPLNDLARFAKLGLNIIQQPLTGKEIYPQEDLAELEFLEPHDDLTDDIVFDK